ncbi:MULTISPECIES: hypothetical protein [unclassified Bacillus (in: firmicutes)]|uniref:hypothetical protein n=1 Tax=unclassified Bacillus (in: firmicutes) TaxID=185979 RepID=UPI0020D28A7C|nr:MULTISPECIES: hypothetical protein [unclassified Bacillus (in: firmicutes)]
MSKIINDTGIILQTGAIDRGLIALARRMKNKGILVIPISMIIFSLGGSTFGMSEETIPLCAIFISLMFVLKFDSITAILILFLGNAEENPLHFNGEMIVRPLE